MIARCEEQSEPEFALFEFGDLLFDHEESISEPPSCRYKKLVSVGSINMDITLNVEEPPSSGSTIITTSSCMTLGGKGANQAIASARLGREVTITGKAYIHVQKDAESSITILPGANQNLFPEDISSREHLFEGCGYCLISTEIPVETCICAAETARKYGAQTIVKPAALKTLPDKLLKNTDIFVPNRKEAALLCPQETEVDKQAAFFFSLCGFYRRCRRLHRSPGFLSDRRLSSGKSNSHCHLCRWILRFQNRGCSCPCRQSVSGKPYPHCRTGTIKLLSIKELALLRCCKRCSKCFAGSHGLFIRCVVADDAVADKHGSI